MKPFESHHFQEPFTGSTEDALNIIGDDLVQGVPSTQLKFYEQVFECIQERIEKYDEASASNRKTYKALLKKRDGLIERLQEELKLALDALHNY